MPPKCTAAFFTTEILSHQPPPVNMLAKFFERQREEFIANVYAP
jgi:hypothetical protein